MPALTMTGRITDCLLIAARTPADSIAHLLPAQLRPMTVGGFAFWNIVVCRIHRMRPLGVPGFMGVSYTHVAHRLYVEADTVEQGTVSGLYFIRSDVDHSLLGSTGNWMTDFRFHKSEIELEIDAANWRLKIASPNGGQASLNAYIAPATHAPESPFTSIDEAKRVLKYQPLGLSVSSDGRRFKLAEVLRDESAWVEHDANVKDSNWQVFDSLGQSPVIELTTVVEPIDYRWRLGRSLKLRK